jgi:predicted RNA methylase
MGRFASTVEFYSRHREPYPTEFFANVAERIALRGNETLLDIGCGPGLLAIGFATFVARNRSGKSSPMHRSSAGASASLAPLLSMQFTWRQLH